MVPARGRDRAIAAIFKRNFDNVYSLFWKVMGYSPTLFRSEPGITEVPYRYELLPCRGTVQCSVELATPDGSDLTSE